MSINDPGCSLPFITIRPYMYTVHTELPQSVSNLENNIIIQKYIRVVIFKFNHLSLNSIKITKHTNKQH